MVFTPLGSRPRRRRKERPHRICMGCSRSTGTLWKWLCDGCFKQLPFPRRKAIAEASQAREPTRVFGLCRDAAEWLSERRQNLLTEEEVVVDLAARVQRRGDGKRVARQLGISQPALSNVLTGGRGIGEDLAQRLGLRRVVMFEPIDS
jgi:hypothetical protein